MNRLGKLIQFFHRIKAKSKGRKKRLGGFEPSTVLAWSQQDEEHLKALRKAELATRILTGTKAMRKAEALRHTILELEARRQAVLSMLTGDQNQRLTVDKLPVEGLTVNREIKVNRKRLTSTDEVNSRILELVAQGKSLRQISHELGISYVAVHKRLKRLQSKPAG